MPELLDSKDRVQKLCTHCNKAIVSFGRARKNGKPQKDWGSRPLHKKCWKIVHGY